ncbi:MAG: hypothetical protein GX446_07450, partial [Chthonomonadales bacterium]|nr:hypothetical protein [Chthonomonadales bacterium]
LPDVDSWVIVDASGRVHLRNVVHKSATTAKEAGYFAFPAAVQAASSRAFVDVPFGFVEAERSQLAGACRDWYACSTHAAIADAEHCVTVAMPHSPLVTFGDIFRGRWLRKVEPADVVFAYAFNNYWDTNYCARQGGPLVYAFSLELAPGSYDPIRAARFGQECALAAPDPARARWQGSVLDGSEFALVDAPSEAILSPPISVSGAEVFGIERDGEKLSIHLLNLSAQPTHAELRVPWRRSVRAFRTNLVGERPQSVPIRHGGSLSIEIGPYAPATVHITLGASPSRPSP